MRGHDDDDDETRARNARPHGTYTPRTPVHLQKIELLVLFRGDPFVGRA